MKYESTDERTGYELGEVVNLTQEQLSEVPFNAKMRLVDKDVKEIKKKSKKVVSGDLDGDGDFDADDKSIAARVLRKKTK